MAERFVEETLIAEIDEIGRLGFEAGMAARHGLRPGAAVEIEEAADGLRLRRPVTHLAKLYVEPTARCNLTCRTCIRNVWDEAPGDMSDATFAAVLEGLRAFDPPPAVFFGGFGEPLAHPRIVDMVAAAKALGSTVELITNGVLLAGETARGLIAAGLDRLWVSLDGARPESYADVRLGAALPEVLANVRRFAAARPPAHRPRPEIGIAFVAMRRNIADLPQLLALGAHLGATRYLVTNVLPHTPEMRAEILYHRALNDITYLPSVWTPRVELPKMDVDGGTAPALYGVFHSHRNIALVGHNLGAANNRCPFIDAGAGAIRWDGAFSPCLPLLHTHLSYLNDRERFSRAYIVGTVAEKPLAELWHDAGHLAFRRRVQAFDFSPCTFCGGCDYSLANEEDCFGNTFPTCGGCLWAQGIIRCP
ncbi:MAG: radical SAM protein [Anaerolineae bacterium]|nr:radical SAM protein [Anaerolineae bacterium]